MILDRIKKLWKLSAEEPEIMEKFPITGNETIGYSGAIQFTEQAQIIKRKKVDPIDQIVEGKI